MFRARKLFFVLAFLPVDALRVARTVEPARRFPRLHIDGQTADLKSFEGA
jgi:hypothetical protein